MSFYIRLNKSVMTFDGLASAYVCFLKMVREERGERRERGRRAWRRSTGPQGATPGNMAGTSTTPSSHPNLQWIFLRNSSTPAWPPGCLCTLPDLASLCPRNLWCNLSRGCGQLSHKFKATRQRADMIEAARPLHPRAMALPSTQFPCVLPSLL